MPFLLPNAVGLSAHTVLANKIAINKIKINMVILAILSPPIRKQNRFDLLLNNEIKATHRTNSILSGARHEHFIELLHGTTS